MTLRQKYQFVMPEKNTKYTHGTVTLSWKSNIWKYVQIGIRPLAESPLNRVKYMKIAHFLLLPFSWISVQGFLDFIGKEICILLRNTCTILFCNLKSLAKYVLMVTKVEAKHLLSSLSVGQVNYIFAANDLSCPHPICKYKRYLPVTSLFKGVGKIFMIIRKDLRTF